MNKLGRKKAMMYGLVLVAALFGLIIDRLSGGPAEASNTAQLVTPVGAVDANKPRAGTNVSGPAIAQVFEVLLKEQSGTPSRPVQTAQRDVFQLTPVMQAAFEEMSPERKATRQKTLESELELRRQELARFQSAHTLKGTTLQGERSWAIIDDRVVRVGETVDGYQLVRVERYRVQLVKGDRTVTLDLPLP
ncbi:MAG TPA: hypothetical protein PK458_16610 [Phycisphaerae bacterium]|nr:hypothetical protein [Phycisphaerae bacterium]HOM51312.1 hypothetical protein [Phycisphaerae bacterium]HON65120.1 hypothetical protein [Phycisphaerae bacterium]HPP26724.1 hypothetical protein [Phycisphaerae bacterium]HPU27803.1 hypothetical protein [Phycisphaerae bacterium]